MSQTQTSKTDRSIRIERGIYRVNYPNQKGVRAYLKFKDREYQKVFRVTDSVGKTIAEAKAWREEKLREIQASPEAANPLKRKQKNNKTGFAGVRRGKTAYGATWVENGVQKHRSFAIEKFGKAQAFFLACQARAEAEKRLFGKIYQPELEATLAAFEVVKAHL